MGSLLTNRKVGGKSANQTTEYAIILENSFLPVQGIPLNERVAVLATLYEEPVLYSEELANCVEKIESGGDPLAYNPKDTDGREKFGLFQFGQLEWDTLCSGDKWNEKDQELCFKALIEAGQGRRWPSVGKCL